jgi:tetratricopeptide (TPR) repeat protein
VWLNAILYVGKANAASRSPREATRFAEAMIELDPYFYDVYSWHSAVRMFMTDYPSPKDIEEANRILKKGMEYFPDDWRLPNEIVSNYIGFTRDVPSQTRIKQARTAAHYAEVAAQKDGAPDHLPMLASAFHRKAAKLEQGLNENQRADVPLSDSERDFLINRYLYDSSERVRQYSLRELRRADMQQSVVARIQQQRSDWKNYTSDAPLSYLPLNLRLIMSSGLN